MSEHRHSIQSNIFSLGILFISVPIVLGTDTAYCGKTHSSTASIEADRRRSASAHDWSAV